MRALALVLSVLIFGQLLSGCGTLGAVHGPASIPVTAADRSILEGASQLGATHEKLLAATDEAKQRQIRDTFLFSRLALNDIAFIDYARSLSGSRRNLDSATEAAQMTLSIVATLTGTERAKSNLAAAVAGITGLKSNVDKNYFDNQGTDALLSMMSARRKEVLARIIRSSNSDIHGYPLLAAKIDADEYYQAGTMEGAFLVIHADASKRDAEAQAELKGQQLVRNIKVNLGTPVQAIKRQLTLALDPATVTLESAHKALQALEVAKSDLPATLPASLEILQGAVRNAREAEQVKQLKQVFVEAGIPLK